MNINKIKGSFPYLYAVIGEGVGILVNFLMFALIQHKYGVQQLAMYMLIRRTISMILPAVLAGIPLSLVRYLSVQEDPRHIRQTIILGLLIPSSLVSLLMIIGALMPDHIAKFLLGSNNFSEYIFPLVLFTAAMAASLLIVSIFKGFHKINYATSLAMIFISFVPLASFIVSDSLINFFTNCAIGILICILVLLSRIDFSEIVKPSVKINMDFITFGIKGASCEFLLMLMLWLPPFIIASSDEIEIAGYFSLMMSLVLVASSPLSPIASAMMPKFAKHVHRKEVDSVNILFYRTLLFIGLVTFPIYLISIYIYPFIAGYLLPGAAPIGQKATYILLTTIIPVSTYYGLRNMIDVFFTPKRNLINLIIASALFLLVYFGVTFYNPHQIRIAVVMGFVTGMWSLGVLTLYYIYYNININVNTKVFRYNKDY